MDKDKNSDLKQMIAEALVRAWCNQNGQELIKVEVEEHEDKNSSVPA